MPVFYRTFIHTFYRHFIYLLLFLPPFLSNAGHEQGYIEIKNFSSNDYNGHAQNWAILQDHRGLMYFGNNSGVIEYDGINWRTIKVSKETAVRSLAMDQEGTIYVGAVMDFGYLTPDSLGMLIFQSLLEFVPKQFRDFKDVWSTHVTTEGVYFQTGKNLFLWTGDTILNWTSESAFQNSFFVNNVLYLKQTGTGLVKMHEGNIVPVKGGEIFDKILISSILKKANSSPLKEEKVGFDTLLIVSRENGIFTLVSDENSEVITVMETSGNLLSKHNIRNVIHCNDFYSIGTWGTGVFSMDHTGKILHWFTKESGLQDEAVNHQYIDKQGNLWLALSNGISRIAINSSITKFDRNTGLEGTIETINRHRDKLYVGTHLGIYSLDYGKYGDIIQGTDWKPAYFKSIPNIPTECWDLLSFSHKNENLLLAALTNGIYQIHDDDRVERIVKCSPYGMFQSSKDSSRIFVGLENGLISLYRQNNSWISEGKVPGIDELIFKMTADDQGNYWLGTLFQGVIKMATKEDDSLEVIDITRFNDENGLPEKAIIPNTQSKLPLFATGNGIYHLEVQKASFSLYPPFASLFESGNRAVHRFSFDHKSNAWMVTYFQDGSGIQIGYIDNNGSNATDLWNYRPFYHVSKEIIHAIYHDPDQKTWLGGTDGLYQFEGNRIKEYEQPFHTLVREVIFGENGSIFNGVNFNAENRVVRLQTDFLKQDLPYSKQPMIFKFAAQFYEAEEEMLFSYLLEGFDEAWSAWDSESKAVYTNLPQGEYQFKVRAKNVYDHISEEAIYEFTVLPPWYQTTWAYLGYVLLLGGFVFGIVTISTRSLKTIIRIKTAEIVHQKEEIEEKNKDITDSINYGKRIQDAILPDMTDLHEELEDSFVLFKPKAIVSGDFYWFSKRNNKILFTVADCTGHGVPGAFMSMISAAFFNEAVNEKGITKPHEILNEVRSRIVKSLKQKGGPGSQNDGLDAALCTLSPDELSLEYAGANNSVYITRKSDKPLMVDGEPIQPVLKNNAAFIFEIKADKQPVGYYTDEPKPFTSHKIDLEKGDSIYMSSDGYPDQFGGNDLATRQAGGKKFKNKTFKKLLVEMIDKPMSIQKSTLDETIEKWRGELEQVDDICVIGVRI